MTCCNDRNAAFITRIWKHEIRHRSTHSTIGQNYSIIEGITIGSYISDRLRRRVDASGSHDPSDFKTTTVLQIADRSGGRGYG